MSVEVTTGRPFIAWLTAPDGVIDSLTVPDPGQASELLGARLEVPVTRAIVSAWQRAVRGIDGDDYWVGLEGPLKPGAYQLVWRTGDPEPPAFEAFVPVIATGNDVTQRILDPWIPPVWTGSSTNA